MRCKACEFRGIRRTCCAPQTRKTRRNAADRVFQQAGNRRRCGIFGKRGKPPWRGIPLFLSARGKFRPRVNTTAATGLSRQAAIDGMAVATAAPSTATHGTMPGCFFLPAVPASGFNPGSGPVSGGKSPYRFNGSGRAADRFGYRPGRGGAPRQNSPDVRFFTDCGRPGREKPLRMPGFWRGDMAKPLVHKGKTA